MFSVVDIIYLSYNVVAYTWHPIFTFAFRLYDLSTYLFLSVERAPAQCIGIFHQQPPVQAKAASTQQQSLERTFQPILAGHCVDDCTTATKKLNLPVLDPFLSLDLFNNTKCRVTLLQQCMLDVMQQPTPSQTLCEIPLATPPKLTHMHSAFFVHGNFRKTNLGPSTEGLDTSVSLYTFCPMDTMAPSYAAAVEEVNRLQQESFMSSGSSMTTGVVGRVNQAKTLQCLISALVFISATIKSLAEFPEDDHHPVLCTALENMAAVLSSRTLQEKACAMKFQSHLRTHFILNIIHGNISAFL